MGWLSSRESSLRHGSSHSEARGKQVKRTRASYSRERGMDVAREGLSVERDDVTMRGIAQAGPSKARSGGGVCVCAEERAETGAILVLVRVPGELVAGVVGTGVSRHVARTCGLAPCHTAPHRRRRPTYIDMAMR